jgi:hypothetical protein
MEKIPENALKLYSIEGFIEEYYSQCRNFNTDKEAYLAVEQKYSNYFGYNRYASFESFRVTRRRFLTKNREK